MSGRLRVSVVGQLVAVLGVAGVRANDGLVALLGAVGVSAVGGARRPGCGMR